jgi:hypothetical protein
MRARIGAAAVVGLAWAAGCNAIFGIDEIEETQRPAAAGADASAGSGGKAGSGGAKGGSGGAQDAGADESQAAGGGGAGGKDASGEADARDAVEETDGVAETGGGGADGSSDADTGSEGGLGGSAGAGGGDGSALDASCSGGTGGGDAGGEQLAAVNPLSSADDWDFFGGCNNRRAAQDFTAFASGGLSRIRVRLMKIGNPGDDVRVTIYRGGTLPESGQFLGSSTVTAASIPGPASNIDFAFQGTPGVPVVCGERYYLVFERSGPLDCQEANLYRWGSSQNAVEPGKAWTKWKADDAAAWSAYDMSARDHVFEVWVGGTAGSGGGAGTGGAGAAGGGLDAAPDVSVDGSGGSGGSAGKAGSAGSGGGSGAAGSAGAAGFGGAASGCSNCGPLEQCWNNQFCVAKAVPVTGGYSIDATEVTRSQYEAWLASSPSTSGQPSWCEWNTSFAPVASCMSSSYVCKTNCGSHPQVCVDWCDAFAYCVLAPQ